MTRAIPSRTIAMLALGCAVALSSLPAAAQQRASCAVRQVLGRKEPGGIPADLKFLQPQLSKAPFTAWKSFRLLGRTDLQMPRDEAKHMFLVTGHKLQLVYLGREGKRLRLRLNIAKVLNVTYRIANGGTFLQIGLPHGGGTLIVATTCKG